MSRLDTQARKLLELREKYELAKRESDAAKLARDEFESAFWSELEDLGLKSFSMDDGTHLLRRTPTVYHEMLDKQALYKWAQENGMDEEWFGPEPRKKALNEYVKTATENGMELPPGLSIRTSKGITVTKPRGS